MELINSKESFFNDKPYPTHVVEGIIKDNKNVRMIVGDFRETALVITVHLLTTHPPFDCNW